MKKPASRYINQIISLREQKVSWADIAKKLRMSTHVTYKVPSGVQKTLGRTVAIKILPPDMTQLPVRSTSRLKTK